MGSCLSYAVSEIVSDEMVVRSVVRTWIMRQKRASFGARRVDRIGWWRASESAQWPMRRASLAASTSSGERV